MKINQLIVFVFGLFLFACGIESPESAMEFAPPLGLETCNSNGGIFITFWGFNNETYFEGYNIYISDNPSDLINFDKKGERILTNEVLTNKPTIEVTPFSTGPQQFTYFLPNKFYVTTNNISAYQKELLSGYTYYFVVRSYGNGITSRKFSNIATNQYTTN